ncbi:MAG: phenylacetate--CoA ligase family protein [Lachnospiraceae bacterium]|nr:phenylacetate--CoA ligase family protein [Lachnospiraceae bacterium]
MTREQKFEKLRELLIYLSEHNEFYKKVQKDLQYDVYHDDIREIYKSLPYTSKQDILKNPDIYFSDNLKKEEIYSEVTSGSSGNILTCYKTGTERTKLAFHIWKQRRLFDPEVNVTNYCNLFNNEMEERVGRFYNVEDGEVIANFYKLAALKPRWIAGPISLLTKFALLIQEGNIRYENDGTLTFIEFHGENVDENSRRLIEQTFACRTLNNYGTRETWCVALDCGEQKLHTQDYILPDFIHEDGYDKLVLTSLMNKYMPIIKYVNGDCGKPEQTDCSCGNDNEIISLRGGRETDLITGTHILGNYLFDRILWDAFDRFGVVIHEYQVHQTAPERFRLLFAKGAQYTDEVSRYICRRIREELGEGYQAAISFVDHVKPLGNGKLKKFYPYQEK